MYELISEVKRIILKKETINGDFYVKFRGSNNVIIHGYVYEKPENLDGQEIIFQGEWEELSANQEKVFRFKYYQLKDTLKVFFNKTIKIPMKTLDVILKKYSLKELQEILSESPMQLTEFKGIGDKLAKRIGEKWLINKNDTEIYTKLMQFGFSSSIIINIKTALGSSKNVLKVLKEDPYQLIQVDGVTFSKIDKMVLSTSNLPLSFKNRIIEGVKYAASQYMNNSGNTIINHWELYEISKAILNNDGLMYNKEPYYLHELDFVSAINPDNTEDFILFDNKLTLTSIFDKENYIYQVINEKNNIVSQNLVEDIEQWLIDKQNKNGYKLSDAQKDIVRMANTQASIFSLSGYAGTGKTMVSKLVMDLYFENNKSIHSCALSGVAANRSKIVSGYDSRTIHALLGYDGINYSYNENNTLPYELLVLDEAGMINTDMFYYLLKAINWKRTKLFIIGDPAQLLPVGLGNVYNDLLVMKIMKNVTLTEVFRQQGGSIINLVAQDIRQFKFDEKYYKHNSLGFYTHFVNWNENKELKNKEILDTLLKVLNSNSLKKYNESNLLDLQIITPTRTSEMGTNKLNNIIQNVLNPDEKYYEVKGIKYKKGDKVIHLRNIVMELLNDDLERIKEDKIYNGQIGIIMDVKEDSVYVKYPYENQIVCYEYDLLKDGYLGLAYVLTAHKCQGNEFKDVIMTVVYSDIMMINPNYLYSAITRAKANLHIVGELNSLLNGLKQHNIKVRETILKNLRNI